MLKINRKIEYAFIALNHMAQNKERLISAKEICDSYDLPFDPTSRALQILAQNGYLKATQGINGGYRIVKDLSRVSLKDLSDMLIGPIEITKCQGAHPSKCIRAKKCNISKSIKKLNKQINQYFDSIKLTEIIEV